MPYNIVPITDSGLIEIRRRMKTEEKTAEIHQEREKRLKEYVKDFDIDVFDNKVENIKSFLEVYRDAAMRLATSEEVLTNTDAYYFTMESILKHIDNLWNMIEGYDEYVSQQQAKAKGYEDWLPDMKDENGESES